VTATDGYPGKATAASGAETPVLLFFHSPTSGPCRRIEPFLAQVLQRRGNHATFRLVRVDVDLRPELAERFAVTELPTLLVIADGKRRRISQPHGRREIDELLRPWLR
jgi:thioredoxin-like negative regulator of GroEL